MPLQGRSIDAIGFAGLTPPLKGHPFGGRLARSLPPCSPSALGSCLPLGGQPAGPQMRQTPARQGAPAPAPRRRSRSGREGCWRSCRVCSPRDTGRRRQVKGAPCLSRGSGGFPTKLTQDFPVSWESTAEAPVRPGRGSGLGVRPTPEGPGPLLDSFSLPGRPPRCRPFEREALRKVRAAGNSKAGWAG